MSAGSIAPGASRWHAIEQVQRERTEAGRGRCTLWTGDIGVALYLGACLDGRSDFPTVDTF
jgi:hypothetical protein